MRKATEEEIRRTKGVLVAELQAALAEPIIIQSADPLQTTRIRAAVDRFNRKHTLSGGDRLSLLSRGLEGELLIGRRSVIR